MLLELKNLFSTEGEKRALVYEMDLSDVELGGVRPFVSPVQIRAEAQNRAGAVRLTAEAFFDFAYPCDRCAALEAKPRRYTFSHQLVQSLNDESNEDYIEVSGDQLDLDELLRDDILLELPTKYLCRPDCKGLCPQCGRNLNEGDCGCDKRQVDPRLEVLKQLIN